MMKALTLYQPWAYLVALREKTFETRSWWTGYRGPILIHAAKKFPPHAQTLAELDTQFLKSLGHEFGDNKFKTLPFGKIVAVAELVNCYKIDQLDKADGIPVMAHLENYGFVEKKEVTFGDYRPIGRFAWQLKNVHQLAEPIQAKGMQRIWNWDETPHLVAIDPWVIGPTRIWTPAGVRSGKRIDPSREDAVLGLEVM